MRKTLIKIFAFLLFLFPLLGNKVQENINVSAGTTEYEEADQISIGDLYGSKRYQMNGSKLFSYVKTAERGSLVFTFELDNEQWTDSKKDRFQIYFCIDDGTKENYRWNNKNYWWFQTTATYMMKETSPGVFENKSVAAISADDHSIELGRLCIKENGEYTNKYYVYTKVDGTIIDSCINTYDYTTLKNEVHISYDNQNKNVLVDPFIEDDVYETADEISVSDLSKNGVKVGGKVGLASNTTYTYKRSTIYGSVVFKFKYKIPSWSQDCHGSQFHLSSSWQKDGMFWLRPDANRIAYVQGTSNLYVVGPSMASGEHDIELGRLAITRGGDYTGSCYFYIKVDGVITTESILKQTLDQLSGSSLFITAGVSDNQLIDSDWEGNQITFMSNGQVFNSYKSKEDYLVKPSQDPSVPGKTFLGWFDKLGNKWDFTNSKVEGDLTLTAGFSSSSSTIDQSYFSDENFTPVIRFAVSSDNHISSSGSRTDRLTKTIQIAYQYAKNSTTYNNLDAALFAGDLSDDGSSSALTYWKNTVNAAIKNGTAVIVSMGNHEYRTYDSVTREKLVFEEIMDQEWDVHVIINGFHFIAVSPNFDEGYHFTETKIKWLEEQLALAATDTPNKPIFVMQHENIKGTVYGSEAWGMDELTETLCKYPQVVDFSGHSHYPLADPRSIWQGTFTALSTGTLHYYELGINGYKNNGVFVTDNHGGYGSSTTTYGSTAEFQIVEVDANNCMRVIVYDVLNEREITRYYLNNLLDERKVLYSHTERASQASLPYFDNASVVAEVKENSVNITFDQAKCDDIIESYRIKFYVGGKLVKTEYALSDYFLYPVPEQISVDFNYLEENTEYTIQVYAVNVWGQESTDYIDATFKTGAVQIYEDVVDEISLNDLMRDSGKKMTTADIHGYHRVYFTPSENNKYGSFKLTMQLLYVSGDFQICFDEEFNNDDLIWFNNGSNNVWFIKDNFRSAEPVQPGLHIIEYGRYHNDEGAKQYNTFYVKIDNVLIHEYKSSGSFTNNGHFSLNFGGAYNAGSRYYDITETVAKEANPEFTKASDVILNTPISNWNILGGAITFDSPNSSVSVWLEDATSKITSPTTFTGKLVLSESGYFYRYVIKTNKFDLGVGVTGEEDVAKFCFEDSNLQIANLNVLIYTNEKYDIYDEISVLDIDIPNCEGIYQDNDIEHRYYYVGTSGSYSAVLKFYLVCNDLNSLSEFRSQLGTLWTYGCTVWVQAGNPNSAYFGWLYSTRPADSYTINLQSNTTYLFETGIIRIVQGEWTGYNYVYFKIDNNIIAGYYAPSNECVSNVYGATFKVTNGYQVADVSLGRTVQYVVDGNNYGNARTVCLGTTIYEPDTPVKSGKIFAGWYTSEVGGERVDFSKPFNIDGTNGNVKLYARFADNTSTVKFYNGTELYQEQVVGNGGLALVPTNPIKESTTYQYDFAKWIDKNTKKEFNFLNPINGDVELEAVFEEHQYKIDYLYEGLHYATRYYLESDKQIIDGEPDTPNLVGANGYWEYIGDIDKEDIYARARYNGTETVANNNIKLDAYNGEVVDIADDLTRFYLSFSDSEEQGKWITDYPISGGHERQNITFSWTDSTNNKMYLAYFADNEDFNNAFIVKTNTKSLDYVGIFTPGKTYYWKVIGLNNNYASSVDTFTVLNTPVRWFSAGTVYNTRDIGGWTTIDNKQVNYGFIYRGGQLKLDGISERSYMNDYSYKVFDYLGMKTEIELRGDSPHPYNQFNELEKLILVNGIGYNQFFSASEDTKQNYRDIFTALANIDNYPFYFHCSWGADRTGGLGFLINGVLGVPYEQLVQDYELTTFSYSGKRTRDDTVNGPFSGMVDNFMQLYSEGGTLQDAVYNYLVNFIGVLPEEIASLKEIMLSNITTEPLVTHTVTYMVNGEVYQVSEVYDGCTIKEVTPQYIEKYLSCWMLNGEPFDTNTKVTQDLVLEAVFEDVIYDDYDIITVRDLYNGNGYMQENYIPSPESYTYESNSSNGGRMFIFNYTITAKDGSFDDGVHIELGDIGWAYKAHIWIAGQNSQHIFVNNETPTLSVNLKLEYGKTYEIAVGVLNVLNGPNADKKVFIFMVDNEIISYFVTKADITNNRLVHFAGTKGVMSSVDNTKTVTFIGEDDNIIDTKQVNRGEKVSAITNPIAPVNQIFLGWYDSLGNAWDFKENNVLEDTKLYARFGANYINALVVDDNNIEILSNYKVNTGLYINELALPNYDSTKLEFIGWYNGDTKLKGLDVVREGMNIVCKFKTIKAEEPITPVEPVEPSNGCKNSISSSIAILSILSISVGCLLIKKKEEE